MIEREYGHVHITAYGDWAEIETPAYPDGTVKNDLSADDLRDLAGVLNEIADSMEERDTDE